MVTSNNLLEMLIELQQLDRVARSGFALRGVADPESVSEHSYHVAVLVWVLAPHVPGIDRARSLEIALIHDLAEVRTGDLPLTAAQLLPLGAKESAESAALGALTEPIGERALQLLAEYQKGTSLEARLVKASDKLQLLLKVVAYEQAGATGLSEFWQNPGNFPDLGLGIVDDLVEALRARYASGRG